MSQVQAATLIKKPVTAADFLNNAEVLRVIAIAATERYNEAVAAHNKAIELENVGAGSVVTFSEGKGDKAEVLSGQVITKLESGEYQVLVQFVGGPAKLSTVKPSAIIALGAVPVSPDAVQVDDEPVEAPAQTPEFDAPASTDGQGQVG